MNLSLRGADRWAPTKTWQRASRGSACAWGWTGTASDLGFGWQNAFIILSCLNDLQCLLSKTDCVNLPINNMIAAYQQEPVCSMYSYYMYIHDHTYICAWATAFYLRTCTVVFRRKCFLFLFEHQNWVQNELVATAKHDKQSTVL
jgi:hypothetical protein